MDSCLLGVAEWHVHDVFVIVRVILGGAYPKGTPSCCILYAKLNKTRNRDFEFLAKNLSLAHWWQVKDPAELSNATSHRGNVYVAV